MISASEAVLLDEDVVEARHQRRGGSKLLAAEAELERELAGHVGLKAGRRVYIDAMDGLGMRRGDLFDFHAALGRAHENRPADAAVDQDGEVQLAVDGRLLFDQHPAYQAAFGAGLGRDERHAEDLAGNLLCFLWCRRQLDATAFAAPAGVDLGLHDHWDAEL